VLYDLIPLTHPDFVGVKRRDAFLDYLKKAATHSDLLLAISHTVRDQVASYLPTLAGPHDRFCQDIRAFPLGAELQTATGPVREEVRRLFDAPQAPYLMVATFDPRKNHRDVLDAFDLLWDQGSELKLCLVGRIGSRCDDILQRVRTHARLGKQLYLFDDLSDCELHHGYAGARGVIFPSVVEGFGLPIVESLWYGRKTFVSDTPIHREVGQGDCCYFQIDVPGSLAAQIRGWETLLSSGQAPSLPTRKPTSWRDCTQHVLAHCRDMAAGRSGGSQPAKAQAA
ncbi:MAG: glycosyltransferase family 4 protein, partial [Planctomycetales bacterium]|nr:glycosyltransferase family 4 protein [Planctomycetales bacterium]